MKNPRDQLDDISLALSESRDVRWDDALNESTDEDGARLIANLKVISAVGSAHRKALSAARGNIPFPRWGRLEVLERIGAGSYGEVYRAHDETLGRDVALKLFPTDRSTDPMRAAVVIEEARRLARIRHENVVQVYGAEVNRGRLGFWMELIPGRTLAQVVDEDGPVNEKEAAPGIGDKVARALTAVHGADLLHRDVKASNVVLGDDGNVFLMDFGSGSRAEEGLGTSRKQAGTPLYMAPETLTVKAASNRSDIYSVGVLMYYLVTGDYPVKAHDMDELVEQHRLGAGSSLSEAAPRLSPRFRKVVDRCLAPNPALRYETAEELSTELGKLLHPVGYRWLQTAGWIAAAAAIAVTLFLQFPGSSQFNIELKNMYRHTFSGEGRSWVWSPSGNRAAYTDGDRILVSDPDESDVRQVAQLQDFPAWELGSQVSVAQWWPDGASLLIGTWDRSNDGNIYRLDLDSGEPTLLVRHGLWPRVGEDAEELYYYPVLDRHVFSMVQRDLKSGEESPYLADDHFRSLYFEDAPGGSRVLQLMIESMNDEVSYWVKNRDGSNPTRLDLRGLSRVHKPISWLADESGIVFAASGEVGPGIWVLPLDSRSPVLVSRVENEGGVRLSPDGKQLVQFRTTHTNSIHEYDIQSRELGSGPDLTVAVANPVPTHGEDNWYFQTLVDGRWEIWSWDVETGRHSRRHHDPARSFAFPMQVNGEFVCGVAEADPATHSPHSLHVFRNGRLVPLPGPGPATRVASSTSSRGFSMPSETR